MPSATNSAIAIGTYYETESVDPGFAKLAEQFKVDTDNDGSLAEFIEAEGRERIRRNLPVELKRYLEVLPRLAERIDPLDAAIDMSMRWLAKSGMPDQQSIEKLAADYPELAKEIRDSAVLSNAIWSTTQLRTDIASTRIVKALPCAFGPVIDESGRRRYELEDLVGEGAFGKVFLATDNQLSEAGHNAAVSIKVFAGQEITPWARQRFVEEATKARRIDHPNVVRVFDRGVTDEDEEFIVHEFVEGGDLSKWSRRRPRPIPVDKSVRLIAAAARGVHAAHMAGLVHCDLKPGNIMMTADGTPKVADFGIAIRSAEDAPRGDEPQPRGNLAFISPEQYRQESGALTAPSDIYALGGMLFWLLTDKLPNGSTPEEIDRHHNPLSGPVQPPSMPDCKPSIPADLQAICARAMATAPDERYASGLALADDLDAWCRREPIPWTRPSILKRLRLWSRRKPGLAVASLCILVLALAGTAMGIIANERRIEAEGEKARNAQTLKIAHALKAKLLKDIDEGADTELLPQLWAMEWFFGPQIMGDPTKRPDFWGLRMEIVRQHIDDAEAAGRGDEVDTLLWKSSLAFWLISAGDHEEATPLIDQAIARCGEIVPAQKRWEDELHALRACADANALFAQSEERPLTNDELAKLDKVTQQIETYASGLDQGIDRGSLVHAQLLRTVQQACGPALLGRAERAAEIAATLKKFDE